MNKIRLAGCIIKDDKDRILLLHRNMPNRVQWETPGGKIEDGENDEDAAQRELLEEIGVNVKIILKLGEQSFREDEYEMHYIWYLAKIESGVPKIVERNKYDKLEYYSFEAMKSMNDLSPNAKNLVDAYYAGRLFDRIQ